MKLVKDLINKIRNLNFDFSLYAERLKDDIKRKYRALKVRLKKVPWIYKAYVVFRQTKYKFKNSKFYLSITSKIDKLLTRKVRATLWSIKRSTGYKFVVRACIIFLVIGVSLSILNKNSDASYSRAASYSEEREQEVASAGDVNEDKDNKGGTPDGSMDNKPGTGGNQSEPKSSAEPTTEPTANDYVAFVPSEDNSAWLKGARVNNYDETKYFKYKGYTLYRDENVKRSCVCIDVSSHQGDIDWAKVSKAGIRYAMIRVGYRGYVSGKIADDVKFKQNLFGAKKNGIHVGIYFFSQAINTTEALQEANYVIKMIRKYNITMPVAYDGEHVPSASARTNKVKLTNKARTDIAIAFLERIKKAGYMPMIYDNYAHLTGGFQLSRLNNYYVWYARYADTPKYKYGYEMWQYSKSGTVPGIKTKVDLNVMNTYFPLIKANMKNN